MFKPTFPIKVILLVSLLFVFLYYSPKSYRVECDNIAETCFPNSKDLPIDVVYTWVNGSDPLLQKQIELHKQLLENPDKESGSSINKKLNIFTGRSILSIKDKKNPVAEESGDSPFIAAPDCPIEGCIPAPAVVSSSGVVNDVITLEDIKKFIGFKQAIEIRYANPDNFDSTLLFVKFPNVDNVHHAVGKIVTSGTTTIKFKPVFYSPQHGEGPYVKTSSTLMDISSCDISDIEGVSGLLSYDSVQRIICVDKNSQWNVRRLCKHIHPQETHLVWPPWDKYSIGGLSTSDVGAHRFADNEELRYSLRSLSAYAPWVRNIYILTNGQVPNWLNVYHPRIKVIAHHEIFQNKSHLPTFSSPAIETSLHNIPGLSEHFLYFNDDVILGKSVYPGDFISPDGYKIYLAWNIPNCNSGCPPNWLSDGYCDMACNVSACNYDGGDCTKGNPSVLQAANNILNLNVGANAYAQMYCNPGCSHSWICDKYCDPACNVENCGFDAGDCGIKDMKEKLFEINISIDSNNTVVEVPRGVLAMYMNMSIPNVTVTAAHYEGVEGTAIRTATISLHHKLLALTLFKNKTESVELTLILSSNNKLFINLVINTYPATIAYAKPIPLATSSSKGVAEVWDIPLLVKLENLVEDPVDKIGEIIDSVDVSKLEESDQAEYERLSELVKQGVLTEKGKWYKLGTYLRNNHNGIQDSDKLPQRLPQSVIKEFIPQRTLLDSFADSLHHVNNLYTKNFGKSQRKVLSHMPFMINRTIIMDLHSKFPDQFNKTASNRFRSSDDMQFAFSYYYYMIHAIKTENSSDLLYRVDINKDGKFSEGELEVLQTRIFALPISPANRTLFNETLVNCTKEKHIDIFTPTNLVKCPNMTEILSSALQNVSLYPHDIVDDKFVTFKMLKSNATKVRIDLDYIRSNPKKFICLNDNMDHKSDNYHRNFKMLHDFYETMYPNPSPFEHPIGVKNDFLYKSEYINRIHFSFNVQIFCILAFLMILLYVCILKRRSFCRLFRGCIISNLAKF